MVTSEAGNSKRSKAVAGAAVLMAIAGVIHLVIIPHHWEHARAHGIFMAIAGLVEIGWAIAFWLRPTRRMAEVGMLIATSLITLWVVTRLWPAPFSHGPEEVDTSGIVTKLLEGVSILVLFGAFFQFLPDPHLQRRIWQTILPVMMLSIVIVLGKYQIARAAEPLFPALMATEDHEEDEHGHPAMDMPMEELEGAYNS